MRSRLWEWLSRKTLTEGQILPWWAMTVRWALFPVDCFYWRFGSTRGYQWQTDTWLIDGVHYSSAALRQLSQAQGETFRITRTG